MDILLVNPNQNNEWRHVDSGLASLESYLQNNGVQCTTIHSSELDSYTNLAPVIGIKVLHESYAEAQRVSKTLHDKTIIWGGVLPTSQPEYILRENEEVDYAVLGEGEERLLQLFRNLHEPQSIAKMDGIAYRVIGEIKVNAATTRMDLDKLTIPTKWTVKNFEGRQQAMVEVGRGCYGKCIYCPEPNKMTFKSAEKVVEEIKYWYDKNINWFELGAVNSIVNGRLLSEIIDILENEKMHVSLELWGRSNDVVKNKAILQRMYESDFVTLSGIQIGIEANTQHALDLLEKGTTPQENRSAMEIIAEFNEKHIDKMARTFPTIILFPHYDMNVDDFVENARFFGDYRPMFFTHLLGFAGTKVWHDMKNRGFEERKDRGGEIRSYTFSDAKVDKLFGKMIRSLKENPDPGKIIEQQLMAFYNSGDIKQAVMNFIAQN